jgi:hypothetical protein
MRVLWSIVPNERGMSSERPFIVASRLPKLSSLIFVADYGRWERALDIYFKNMAKRWKGAAAADTKAVVILSPYLTSKTPENVLANVKRGRATICTSFSAEIFASGGSSLKTLKNLAKSGHKLLYLDDLHAKVFLVPGKFASLGSQNLTQNGTRRKEAGVAFKDIASVAIVERGAMKWLTHAVPITAEMISDMEKELVPLIKTFRAARRAAKQLDREVRERQDAREKDSNSRLRVFQRRLDDAVMPGSELSAKVSSIPSSDGAAKCSLIAQNSHYLTRWKVRNLTVQLSAKDRYLCVMRETGRIGWVRLMNTRISFVGKVFDWSDVVVLGEKRYRLSVTANWARNRSRDCNLTITVMSEDRTVLCFVSLFLSVTRLDVIKVSQPVTRGGRGKMASEFAAWIATHNEEFAAACLPELVTPFRYSANLTGRRADQFFGAVGTERTLRIATIRGQRVIVVD